MSAERRLAAIAEALEQAGLTFLVMGGHAVRFYGVERNTVDYDFHVSLLPGMVLEDLLRLAKVCSGKALVEGPSWRPRDFRRFELGRLPDGREEWLEFWIRNHLLSPFAELYARREIGAYGGRSLSFLSLPDLIHSKETERESDWQDIALLEEILDARNLAKSEEEGHTRAALSQVRSRRGFERAVSLGLLAKPSFVAEAFEVAQHVVTKAYLLPFCVNKVRIPTERGVVGEIFAGPLRQAPPNSARHLALVEAVRRMYKQAAMAADRADKAGSVTAS